MMRNTSLPLCTLNTLVAAVLLLAASALVQDSQAQNLYRCGSTFQDKPCDNGQKGQIIKTSPSASAADKPSIDASCLRRGEEAKRVIWMREGGALQDRVQAEAKTSEQRRVIADVYAMKGNASDIRAKIESECMAEKSNGIKSDSRDDEVARHEAAERKASGDNPKNGGKADDSDAARNQKLCDTLHKQINLARSAQKTSGSGQEMESMASTIKLIESKAKELGCSR